MGSTTTRAILVAMLFGCAGAGWTSEDAPSTDETVAKADAAERVDSRDDPPREYLLASLTGRQVQVRVDREERESFKGQLVRVDGDGLVIEGKTGLERFPWKALRRLEVEVGRHSGAGQGLKYGAGVGLTLALIITPGIAADDGLFGGPGVAAAAGSGLTVLTAGFVAALGSVGAGGSVWERIPVEPLMRPQSNDAEEEDEAGSFPEGLEGKKVRLTVEGYSGNDRRIEGVLLGRSAATLWVAREGKVQEVRVDTVRSADVFSSHGTLRRGSLLTGLVLGGSLAAAVLVRDEPGTGAVAAGVLGFGLGAGIAELATPAWRRAQGFPRVTVAPQLVRRGAGLRVALSF